ncbi:MAG TPA: hypothetical protein VFW74_14725 [Acidimicrobiia bacterium]|nr:hypothetical protein [Acidimicrobiia bacterium]
MRAMTTRYEVEASASTVWRMLSGDSVDGWLPTITSRDGAGRLRIAAPVPRTRRAALHVEPVDDGHVVLWRAVARAAGLLETRHRFELRELDAHRTEVLHEHESRGLFGLFPGARRRREYRHRAIDFQLRTSASRVDRSVVPSKLVVHAPAAAQQRAAVGAQR